MPLGETLVSRGLISQAQLQQALDEQKTHPGEKLGEILIRLGFITQAQVESAL